MVQRTVTPEHKDHIRWLQDLSTTLSPTIGLIDFSLFFNSYNQKGQVCSDESNYGKEEKRNMNK